MKKTVSLSDAHHPPSEDPRGGACRAGTVRLDDASQESAVARRVRRRVLVVDDDSFTRELASRMLRAAGHHVETRSSGAEGVAAVRDTAFDVVLMDRRMPGLDGIEAIRAIRALPGATSRARILLFSADYEMALADKDVADGLVAKPFSLALLCAAVAPTE
jgi:CheY-like chemotaxis protein